MTATPTPEEVLLMLSQIMLMSQTWQKYMCVKTLADSGESSKRGCDCISFQNWQHFILNKDFYPFLFISSVLLERPWQIAKSSLLSQTMAKYWKGFQCVIQLFAKSCLTSKNWKNGEMTFNVLFSFLVACRWGTYGALSPNCESD